MHPLAIGLLLLPPLLASIGGVVEHYLERLGILWLQRLDHVQRFTVNLMLGCLTLYFIALALTPFHLFTREASWAIALAFPPVYLWLERGRLRRLAEWLRAPEEHLRELEVTGAIIAIFLGAYAYRLMPLEFITFGSVHDESLHSLFIRLMEINRGIPETHQPYLPQYLIFPQGLHVVFTFIYYLSGCIPPTVVLNSAALFNALSIFGGYFFGKEAHDEKLGLALAFILGFVAQYPIAITWGGDMMPVGILLLLMITGVFYGNLLYRRGSFHKRSYLDLVPLGLLLGYLGAVHLILYVLTVTTMGFIALVKAVKILMGREERGVFLHILLEYLFVVLISLIPMSIWIYRYLFAPRIFIEEFEYEEAVKELVYEKSEKFGRLFPARVIFHPLKHVMVYVIWFNWYVEAGWPGSDLFLTLLFLTPILLLRAYYKDRTLLKHMALSSMPYLSVLFWAMDTPHGLYYLPMEPFSLMTGEADKLMIWLTVALSVYAAYGLSAIYEYILKLFRWVDERRERINRFLLGKMHLNEKLLLQLQRDLRRNMRYLPSLVVVGLTLLSVPSGVYFLAANHYCFSVATGEDKRLMLWMRSNLPSDAVILIDQYEAGTFIPSISHHRVVYPWTGDPSSEPPSYVRLANMTEQGILNETAYQLLEHFNITHVYVGSKTAYSWAKEKWDPLLFLANPNFKLTKKIPHSYLFEYTPTNTSISFQEDFEHANITETGWLYYSCRECRGNGTGCAGIASFSPYNGSKHLLTVSVRVGNGYYACYPYRKIYTPPRHRIILTIYLNASYGFGPGDCVAIVVSDEEWERQVAFIPSTQIRGLNISSPLPNVTMNPRIFPLSSSQGIFKLDLTAAWWEAYRDDVPHPFFLAIVNLDVDGNPNVCLVDSITIAYRPMEEWETIIWVGEDSLVSGEEKT